MYPQLVRQDLDDVIAATKKVMHRFNSYATEALILHEGVI